MIFLHPTNVTLGNTTLTGVDAITLSRTPDRLVVEHSDLGPHVAFIDVPERRATFTIKRTILEDEPTPARPGDAVALTFKSGPSASPASARQITATVVITAVEHTINTKRGVTQTITALAWSTDGATDPITETVVSG